METLERKQIGEYVAQDYTAAAVFTKYGIDFCCNGNRSVEEACAKKGIEPEQVYQDLEAVLSKPHTDSINFQEWPMDLLVDYIEKKHHRYVETRIPVIKQYLTKIDKVHGKSHPELGAIKDLFIASAADLTMHMKKEELILFPYIKKMVKTQLTGTPLEVPQFGGVAFPIQSMMAEHDNEGERFRTIAELSDNYTPPASACNTYKASFALLQEFQEDLHKHIHLENNILFPKAASLEMAIKA